MDKQIIISIGRECGSGGRIVAELIGKKLGIEVLDKNIIEALHEKTSMDIEFLERHDERHSFIKGLFSKSDDKVKEATWALLKEKADAGDSFVVVGRNADIALKDNPNVVSAFISAERFDKFLRIIEEYGFEDNEAESVRKRVDGQRQKSRNAITDIEWGNPSGYDAVVNTSKLGLEGAAEAIIKLAEVKINSGYKKEITDEYKTRKALYFKRVAAGI